jgi:hypothetical protein
MKQTIGNACGTIALLHSIGNVRDKVSLGGGCSCNCWHTDCVAHIRDAALATGASSKRDRPCISNGRAGPVSYTPVCCLCAPS